MRPNMRSLVAGLALACAVAGAASAARAEALRVSPFKLVVPAPATTAALTIRNEDRAPLGVQLRVFLSVMQGDRERLLPTSDVVASPPMVTLKGGSRTTIRIVRVAKSSVRQSERYRLVVDQLPNPRQTEPNAVNFVIRHVIPVDFRAPLAALEVEPLRLAETGVARSVLADARATMAP